MTSAATQGRLFIVSAPSGGGKTSLTRKLIPRLSNLGLKAAISVSYTTRQMRAGEQDGVHYHFVSAEQFEKMAAAGEFFEHAEVFGRRYGTGRKATQALLADGIDVILDIDWQGGRQVRANADNSHSIFILPPSLEELERRLRARGQDDDDTIGKRMAEARSEMSHWKEYDAIIINEDFDRALAELTALFVAPRLTRAEQERRFSGLFSVLMD